MHSNTQTCGNPDATGPAREYVAARDAPAAIGPYSQAVKFGNLLFVSGQRPIDPVTGQLNADSIQEQTARVLENIKAILTSSGMTMENVLSTSVFLKDMNDFAEMNAVYGAYFKENPPARATVQVQRLPRDAMVEISAIAGK